MAAGQIRPMMMVYYKKYTISGNKRHPIIIANLVSRSFRSTQSHNIISKEAMHFDASHCFVLSHSESSPHDSLF